MIKRISKFKFLSFCFITAILCAVIYIGATPKVFLAKSQVAIFRIKVENPDSGSDESRNRWIWIRDGLNINSALLDDESLLGLIKSNKIVEGATQKYTDIQSKLNWLKKLIEVKYTGADENNYLIEVKSTDKELALALNQHVFDRLKYLALIKDSEDFDAIIAKLNSELAASTGEDSAFYKNKIMKLKFENAIFQTQKERAFQAISQPSLTEQAIWPKPLSIILVMGFFGLLLGSLGEFLVWYLKSIK